MNWISFIIFFFFHLVGILFPFHLCANKIMKENKIMREEIQSWPWKSFLLLGFNLQHMIVNDWDRDHDYAVGWKPDQEKEDCWRSRERKKTCLLRAWASGSSVGSIAGSWWAQQTDAYDTLVHVFSFIKRVPPKSVIKMWSSERLFPFSFL
jgi:hypothetical protein